MSDKKAIFGWVIYDLANTAFSALFITFFFPLLIKVYLGGNEFQLGLVMGLSMLLAGILVPLIGAVSDSTGRKIPFVIFFTITCVVFTIITPYLGLYLALLFALLANLAYHSAIDVYDALLVDISTKQNIGTISGYGVATGYLGTILSLIMAYIILIIFGFNTKTGIQAIFPATALFFLAFSTITFVLVKDKIKKAKIPLKTAIKKSFSQLKDTLTNMHNHKGLLPFLIASFIYTDGMNTAILFLYLYGREQIKLTLVSFFYVYAVMAVAAMIGSLVFGRITDKIGPKKTLSISLGIWILIITLLINVNNLKSFLIAGSLGGVALGAIWTATRPMLVQLSPKQKIAELFGFQGLTEKFSGVFGPVIFGYVVVKSGYQPALIVLLGFFILGLLILYKVPSKK
ncbi:MFS transporter [Candidatus Woesearchaeota archaeon]|nr:MFS transporter [Candidatus Woesearchaeota archaeon]